MADAAADAGVDAGSGNPYGIALVDVTATLPALYYGGRMSPDLWGVGSGVALADVDGDGDLDVILARLDDPASGRPGGPPTLLKNDGPAGELAAFVEDASFAAAVANRKTHAAAVGDFDRDGDVDVFLGANGVDTLLVNDGAGGFTDVTAAAGVAGRDDDITVGALWADVNTDGLLDLFVVDHTAVAPPASHPANANRLHLGRGDGTFEDVSVAAGVAGDGAIQAALAADLDGDGDLEIYVANDRFAIDGELEIPDLTLDADGYLDPVAFDDAGRPLYTDRAAAYGVAGPRSSMGIALGDLDGDGADDLYVTDWGANHPQIWSPALAGYVVDDGAWGLAVRDHAGDTLLVSWGTRFVDLDRDGQVEAFVVNGSISEPLGCDTQRQLDVVLRQPAFGAGFVDITASVGLPYSFACPAPADTPLAGRGLAVGDLDGDGDDDLVVSGFVEPYRFYRNDTPALARPRLRVRLRGTVSAPDPIGAVLRVTLPDGQKLHRTLYAGGDTHSQSARVLEIGSDGADAVTSAFVLWPSGLEQRIDALPGFSLAAELSLVEPEWLALSARTAIATDPAPALTYAPVDATGAPLGPAGSGKAVVVTRSDGVAVTVVDDGDGTYSATLPHPSSARVTVLLVTVDGAPLRPHLAVTYH
jgi:hypothetical protein